jgi:chorismate mutase
MLRADALSRRTCGPCPPGRSPVAEAPLACTDVSGHTRHGMSAPKTLLPPADMAHLRARIDGIDRELARLIAERSSLASQVAAAKRAEGDSGFGWRPAREIEVLRAIRVAEPGIDPHLAATVWRAMMAANLAAQGGMRVVALASSEAAARLAVGASNPVEVMGNASACLDAVAAGGNTLAVLPDPSRPDDSALPWWSLMQAPRFAGLHVCAASPQIDTGRRPEALILAARMPEPCGGDTALVAGPPLPLERLGGQLVAQAGGSALVAVPGFLTAGAVEGPGMRLIGTYALA